MTQENLYRIERKPEVLHRTGFSRSVLYSRVQQLLFVPPVSLGGERAVGWVSCEVDKVMAAYIAGHSKTEIQSLVTQLIAQRKNAMGVING